MATTVFLDNFTDSNGALLSAHTPDIAPAGDYTTPDGGMVIQSNRVVGSASGGPSHTSDYAFVAAFEPVYPYTVSVKARSYGLGNYSTGVILSGVSESLKILLVDPTNLSVITNNSESFDTSVGAAEHTVSVYVEDGQFTVTLDGTAQTPVTFAGSARHFDTLTVTLEYPGSGAAYVDSVAVIDASSPATTALAYPTSLPQPSSISVSPLNRRTLTPSKSPGFAVRTFQRDTGATLDVAFNLDPTQADAFNTWYETDLDQGGAWFAAGWASVSGMPGIYCFRGGLHWVHRGYGAWTVTAKVEARGAGLSPVAYPV